MRMYQSNNNTRDVRRNRNNVTRKNVQKDLHSLPDKTTLPKQYIESHKFILGWKNNINKWTEAAPASYRSVLLYIAPSVANTYASAYLCVDNWANKQLRFIPPFCALESLYFNNDDGTASQANSDRLTAFINDLKIVYNQTNKSQNASKSGPSVPSVPSLLDISTPTVNDTIKNLFCIHKTAQGDTLVSQELANVLKEANNYIQNEYNRHFESMFDLVLKIFNILQTKDGKGKLQMSDAFTLSKSGARSVLEGFIADARTKIATHYINVETAYYSAISKVTRLLLA
jgi:hypothetical protein